MNELSTQSIALRLFLSMIFSAVIGLEREKNHSNAGLKTHTIVGISATIIALIQSQIIIHTLDLARSGLDINAVIRSDPARLITGVVSGIGFLGAGTIVVTKRNVSGLTTAASIWSVAAIGLATGMGYLEIAILGFIFLLITLLILKRFSSLNAPQRIIIKYLGGPVVRDEVLAVFKKLNFKANAQKYDIELHHDERVFVSVFEIANFNDDDFSALVDDLTKNNSIVSVQTTNI